MRHYSNFKHNRRQYKVLRRICSAVIHAKGKRIYNTSHTGWWNHSPNNNYAWKDFSSSDSINL